MLPSHPRTVTVMLNTISLPKSELISLAFTFFYGAPINLSQ